MFKIKFLNDLFVGFFQTINNGILSIFPDKNISFGLSIIVLTIIIRMILLPLNIKQIKSSLMMSKLGPEIKKLQAKYKSDPQKLQQETMKLYKEKGVNPLGGCLPLIIQYPILIALYYVFYTLQIKGIGFLWIHDLSKSASLSDWTSWILPVVSGATTYLSGMLMSSTVDKAQAKQTSTMNIVMSIVLFYMSLRFNAALVLYWVTGNVVQILQTKLVMKMVANKIATEEQENKVVAESSVTVDHKNDVNNKKNKRKNKDNIDNN